MPLITLLRPLLGGVILLGALLSPLRALEPLSPAQACLLRSYPDWIEKIEENRLYFKEGSSMLWDDGETKSYEEAFLAADLEDQFAFPYPKGREFEVPRMGEDSSRLRSMEFFKRLYGATPKEVKRSLRRVPWLPSLQKGVSVEVTTINGIDQRIERISRQIEQLPESLRAIALHPSGGFYWRHIAGSSILSMHSFGIALDLDPKASRYWLWDREKKGQVRYKNTIPLEIVEIFEREGFIWGGKWGHYDTMHFEYRPEILCHSH